MVNPLSCQQVATDFHLNNGAQKLWRVVILIKDFNIHISAGWQGGDHCNNTQEIKAFLFSVNCTIHLDNSSSTVHSKQTVRISTDNGVDYEWFWIFSSCKDSPYQGSFGNIFIQGIVVHMMLKNWRVILATKDSYIGSCILHCIKTSAISGSQF